MKKFVLRRQTRMALRCQDPDFGKVKLDKFQIQRQIDEITEDEDEYEWDLDDKRRREHPDKEDGKPSSD